MKINKKLIKANKQRSYQDKLRLQALEKGVKMKAPETVHLSSDTFFGKNVTIEPYVVIGSKVKIGNNVVIKSFSYLEGAKLEKNVLVGPYARIRPGSHFFSGSKIGNFVETKNSKIKSNSKVSHLSYIGDTEIGENSNIGAGTITCNYDGIKKNKTKIKKNVFVGSNSSLVAPLVINENSIIGAGSVITKNVNKNSLTLTRSPQITKKNYKKRKK
tara:strand:+ start:5150 stop:5794 length:645 start_codon:yes stop_codon:yes gene_type:complete